MNETTTTNNSPERACQTERSAALKRQRARSVATSLVLYVVIGTLASGIASAQTPRAGSRSVRAVRTRASLRTEPRLDPKAFKEFLARVREMHASGQIKFNGVQELTITGAPNAEGALEQVAVTSAPAQRNLDQLGYELVRLVNEQRGFSLLRDVERMRMHLRLDRQTLALRVDNQVTTQARAQEMERSWNGLLFLARIARRGQPEAAVLNHMKLSSSGKQLVMSLAMSREALGNLLHKQVTPN